jgi:hypothetical protein
MGVAPSALSFFKVASRWCSITLRFLKYVTCRLISITPVLYQQVSLLPLSCTHPTTCACALKFSELRRAHLLCLLVFPYTVDNAVAIQTSEETIAAIPALCASCAIGCYEAAILGGRRRRRRGLRRRGAEPAHCKCVFDCEVLG